MGPRRRYVLDVREASEIEKDGYIMGSVNIPTRDVLKNLDKLPALDQAIVVTCASGHRGAMVMAALHFLGYQDVRNLAGGTGAWKKASLALVTGSQPEGAAAGTAPKVDKLVWNCSQPFSPTSRVVSMRSARPTSIHPWQMMPRSP